MSGSQTRPTRDDVLADAMRRIRALERLHFSGSNNLDGVYGYNDVGFVAIGNAFTAEPLTAVEFDSLGYWDSGTPGRFTIQKAGWYIVTGWMVLQDGTIIYALNGVDSGLPAAYQAHSPDDFAHGMHVRHFDLGDTLDWKIGKASAGNVGTTGYNVALILIHF